MFSPTKKNGYINDTAYPLFYFGHGLSYTSFAYEDFQILTPEVNPEETICASVKVKNTGKVPGDEIVQLYYTDEVASMVRPTLELAGFCRVALQPGESKTVSFRMKASQTAFLDEKMEWIVEAGRLTLKVGASCQDIRQQGTVQILRTETIDPHTRGFYAQVSAE